MSRSPVEFVPAEIAHVFPIADRMRQADRDEVWAASRRAPDEALAYSLSKSSLALTAIVRGLPEVMFGVGDLNVLTRTGAPWLLGTTAVEREFRLFLRESVRWREQLLQRYDVLRNVVDDRNTVSKRWLRWIGFRLYDPVPLGADGELFRIFEMRR